MSVKTGVLVRPSRKHVRSAALPSCLGSWDAKTVPLVGHQPLFQVCPVAHSCPPSLGKRESRGNSRDSCLCPYSLLSVCILAISDANFLFISLSHKTTVSALPFKNILSVSFSMGYLDPCLD